MADANDDPYLAAATAVMDAVALGSLHGLRRNGRMVTADEAGLPADVVLAWAGGARRSIAAAIRHAAAGNDVTPLVVAALRYRDAARAFGGRNVPGADYAALLRERDAAMAAVLRWADRHAGGVPAAPVAGSGVTP